MRLQPDHIAVIKRVTAQVLGDDARVTLFGSRVDDHARGGDIDLFIETPTPLPNRAVAAARLAASIERQLGGRQIDVVLVDPLTPSQTVHAAARAHGVVL